MSMIWIHWLACFVFNNEKQKFRVEWCRIVLVHFVSFRVYLGIFVDLRSHVYE